MTPVDQIIFEDGRGDCLRACVCSLLDLPIEAVPNFADCGFFDGLEKWCGERNLRIIQIRFGDPEHVKSAWFDYTDKGLCVVWGDSPRFKADGVRRKQHAVVGRANGYGVDVAHDPHPSRGGLHSIYGVMWLVPR